jgi:cytochrome b6-f complex subunit 4
MSENNNPEEKTVPFYPDHLAYEARVAMWFGIGLIIIGIIGLFNPIGLGDPADPMVTPAHTKPEWYFLALFQLLKYLPKTIGAITPVLLILLIAMWPFLDRKKDKTRLATRNRFVFSAILFVVLIILTIFGEAT